MTTEEIRAGMASTYKCSEESVQIKESDCHLYSKLDRKGYVDVYVHGVYVASYKVR